MGRLLHGLQMCRRRLKSLAACQRLPTSHVHDRKNGCLAVLGDRMVHNFLVRQRIQNLREHRLQQIRLSQRARCLKFLSRVRVRLDMLRLSMRCLDCLTIDGRTGLPREVLRTYSFLQLVSEGAHGKVFKSCLRGTTESKEQLATVSSPSDTEDEGYKKKLARLRQDSIAAVRLRDKAAGNVIYMPLRESGRVLQREVIAGSGFVKVAKRCLTLLGLTKGAFKHRCLMQYFAVHDGPEYFVEVTEWMDGGSLHSYIQADKEHIDEHQACDVTCRVLMGVQYLHERGLVHRDVRSQQLLLPEKGSLKGAKLGDFWCLHAVPKSGFFLDKSSPVDPLTTAPEVLKVGHWSRQADVWSVGCVLFEMLNGHPPFCGERTAVMKRVCCEAPEFDVIGSTLSKPVLSLLQGMLKPSHEQRPTATDILKHEWFKEYSVDKKEARAHRDEMRIKHVVLSEPLPPCYKGMTAENLLRAKAGVMRGGFCSGPDVVHVALDFEIGNGTLVEYYVTTISVCLWAKPENPKEITLQSFSHSGATDLMTLTVDSAEQREARMSVNVPLQKLRLVCRGNHKGTFGIAIRKVCFYGYQVKSIESTVADHKEVVCSEGAGIVAHHEFLRQNELDEKVHVDLHNMTTAGGRIEGTGHRWRVYRDIHSGAPFNCTKVRLKALALPTGIEIAAAKLDLAFASISDRFPFPCMKVYLCQEFPDGTRARRLLFDTGPLKSCDWNSKGILLHGYQMLPTLICDNLKVDVTGPLHIELIFDNNAGFVHIPFRFGLLLYYVPELLTPEYHSEVSDIAAQQEKCEREHEEEEALAVLEKTLFKRVEERDDMSNHAESEAFEEELVEDWDHFYEDALYGMKGPRDMEKKEVPMWNMIAAAPPVDNDVAAEVPWYERHSGSSAAASASEDTAEGSPSNGSPHDDGTAREEQVGFSSARRSDRGDAWAMAKQRLEQLGEESDAQAEQNRRLRDQRAQEFQSAQERRHLEALQLALGVVQEPAEVAEEGVPQEESAFSGFACLPRMPARCREQPSCQPKVSCNVVLSTFPFHHFTPSPPPPSPRC